MEGYYIDKYVDINSAAGAVGISATSISKVLRGLRNSAAGFVWRKVATDDKIVKRIVIGFDKKNKFWKVKKIAKLNVYGQVIEEIESIAELARKSKISIDYIQKENWKKQFGGMKELRLLLIFNVKTFYS